MRITLSWASAKQPSKENVAFFQLKCHLKDYIYTICNKNAVITVAVQDQWTVTAPLCPCIHTAVHKLHQHIAQMYIKMKMLRIVQKWFYAMSNFWKLGMTCQHKNDWTSKPLGRSHGVYKSIVTESSKQRETSDMSFMQRDSRQKATLQRLLEMAFKVKQATSESRSIRACH